jgi:choline-glycine betaine transporter
VLPSKLFLAAYLFVMIVFLASHMDAVAYTMAATSTRNLREGEDPDRGMDAQARGRSPVLASVQSRRS